MVFPEGAVNTGVGFVSMAVLVIAIFLIALFCLVGIAGRYLIEQCVFRFRSFYLGVKVFIKSGGDPCCSE